MNLRLFRVAMAKNNITSYKELAKKSNVSTVTISGITTNKKTRPNYNTISKLSNALALTQEEISLIFF